jgi:DNA-binding beta-propeller fold protein YncE
MTTHLLTAAALIGLSVSVLAQAPQRAVQAPPAVWTIATDLAAPESAYFDAASGAVFVSNINGQILDKDGNGYISRLTPDGKVVDIKWATGLNAPKGMRSVGGTLWVTDIDEVVAIDIASGRIASRVKVEGAGFLNDLAAAPDGTVYASDSGNSTIYAVKNGMSSVFVTGAEAVETPNGLLVDGGRLILGTIGPAAPGGRRGGGPGAGGPPAPAGRLYAFDLTTKQRTVVTPQPIGGIDGIEPDGSGGFLVTDVVGSRLLQVNAAGTARTLLTFTAGGADFGYVASRKLAVVPFLFGNSVSAYDLTKLLTN